MRVLVWLSLATAIAACGKAPPPANPEFSDAAVFTLRAFDGSEADLAYALRALEEQTYLGMDVESDRVTDRALTPSRLTDDDIAGLDTPDGVDIADALPVAVAGISAYDVDDNARIPLLVDQTPLEPYSPDYYERTFFEQTEDCWYDRDCEVLLTWNDLIKKNFLMTVPYDFYKDFKWVDMRLPDPAEVPPGEVAVNLDEPRWAYVARSWMTQSAEGENGNTRILQSYTIEVWIPRDGEGFVRDGSEQNVDDGEWTADSTAGGTLRLLSLWSQTEFDGINPSDDTIAGTTRAGIDANMQAHEDWLESH